LIVNGAQHGLATTLMATCGPGDVVAADALTYPGFKVLAHTLRLELAPLPVTRGGPDLDALERLCAKRRVRAIYAMLTPASRYAEPFLTAYGTRTAFPDYPAVQAAATAAIAAHCARLAGTTRPQPLWQAASNASMHRTTIGKP